MIHTSASDGIATITINRPEKANALPQSAKAELAGAISSAVERADVEAVVLTGRGDRAFCAGTDVAEMQGFDAVAMREMLAAERSMYLAALRPAKPVVAAVNGSALGAGLILVMCCDYAVASESARFGAPELTLGVAAPLEGLLLPWIVGLGHAKAMFYTGRQLPAGEAFRVGLVHEVVEPDRCVARALEVAGVVARLPGDGFAIQKRLLYRLISTGHLDAVIEESHLATSLQFASDEVREGIARFLSGRKR